MNTRAIGLGLCAGLFSLAAPASAQERPVAFVNARVIPIAGPEIERGVVGVHRGKIIVIGGPGAIDRIPADVERIDCAGKVIMPGLVDTHSHIGGIGGADSAAPIQPDVRIHDSINIRDSGFRRAVAGGLTTLNIMAGSGHLLSGQTVYVKLRRIRDAARIEDIVYRDAQGAIAGGMKMANGTNSLREPPFPGTRGKSAALVREQYVKAQEYANRRARAVRRDAAGNEVPDPERMPIRDLGLEALNEVLSGARIVQHHTHRSDDIMTVIRLAQEFKFRVVLHHVSEAWKVAGEIAGADTGWADKGIRGTPCSAIVVDSPGGKLEAAEMTWESGAILERAGVTVAFHTDDWITDSRLFLRSAALSVRAGMSREEALRALTINGAKMLDLESRVGSLEIGKDADVVILSGDPLSVYTRIEQTWVEGEKVFDLSDPKDRLYAQGGFGAGHDQSPYLCCAGGAVFTFGGRQWGAGGAGAYSTGE
ncbi:MAG: amidohydrolase family protein [Phycisphaerales bacterium]